jgi:hypothetical protein
MLHLAAVRLSEGPAHMRQHAVRSERGKQRIAEPRPDVDGPNVVSAPMGGGRTKDFQLAKGPVRGRQRRQDALQHRQGRVRSHPAQHQLFDRAVGLYEATNGVDRQLGRAETLRDLFERSA